MNQIEELKQKVQQAKQAIEDVQAAMDALSQKKIELEKELPTVRPQIARAENNKREVMARFLRNAASQQEVDNATQAALKAKGREQEIADYLEVVVMETQTEYAKIVGLNTALVSCEMKLWRQVYKNIQTDFLKSANIDRETLLSGWLAHARAGGIGRGPFKDYLESLFSIEYTTEEITKIREKLEAKYL